MASKVIYTCITDGYDQLNEPSFIQPDTDYVCFTDTPQNFNSLVWNIVDIPDEFKNLPQKLKQRLIKISPHKLFPNYEVSLWMDGSIEQIGNISCIFNEDLDKFSIYAMKHPVRNCLYDEGDKCIKLKKDTKERITPQLDRYKAEGYPKNNGLVETGVMLRKHNDERCIKFMTMWALELMNGSHRDQLSFNYISWKYDIPYGTFSSIRNIRTCNFLKLQKHFRRGSTLLKSHKPSIVANLSHSKTEKNNYTPTQRLSKRDGTITLEICNFNTTEYTNKAIWSVLEHLTVPIDRFIVLDNSTKYKFELEDFTSKISEIKDETRKSLIQTNLEKLEILDNTIGEVYNVNTFIEQYRLDRFVGNRNGYASLKHCVAIQHIIEMCDTQFLLLLDSDIVVHKDLDFLETALKNPNKAKITVSDVEIRGLTMHNRTKPYGGRSRFTPMIQLLNLSKLDELNLNYFNPSKIQGIVGGFLYDTGAYLYDYVDGNDIPYDRIVMGDYITHIGGASWK